MPGWTSWGDAKPAGGERLVSDPLGPHTSTCHPLGKDNFLLTRCPPCSGLRISDLGEPGRSVTLLTSPLARWGSRVSEAVNTAWALWLGFLLKVGYMYLKENIPTLQRRFGEKESSSHPSPPFLRRTRLCFHSRSGLLLWMLTHLFDY